MAAGALATFKRLWRTNRWLTLSFLATVALALFFTIRAGVFFVYWHNHADEPIEGWMTIRYIANSYRVDPRLVHDAIGLPKGEPNHDPLVRIASDEGRPLDALTKAIMTAIEADRAARGTDRPPPPPPEPPGS